MTELNPELDPATEQAVSALLRDARVTEPIPAHVAARMAHVLTTEWQSRSTADRDAVAQVSLPERRSAVRRRLPVLLAAAAVVVGGVAVGPQLLDRSATSDTAGSEAARSQTLDDSAVGVPEVDGALPPEVDVAELRAEAQALWQDPATQTGDAQEADPRSSGVGDCALPRSVTGDLIVPVLERGQPAWLVYTRRDAAKVRVALHTCISGAEPVKKVTFSTS